MTIKHEKSRDERISDRGVWRAIVNWAVSLVLIAIIAAATVLALPRQPNSSIRARPMSDRLEKFRDSALDFRPGDEVNCVSHPELGIGLIVAIRRKYQVYFESTTKALDINEEELSFEDDSLENVDMKRPKFLHARVIWQEHPELGVGNAGSTSRILTVKYPSGIRIQEEDVIPAS